MQFWALVVDSFRQSIDRKIFWIIAAISILVAVMMLSVDFEADRVSFLFGLWEPETDYYNPMTGMGRKSITTISVYLLMDLCLGWIGMILMVIATADIFPSLIQPGAIDSLLAKPIGRGRLFLYKYISSMVFVLLQASLFVGLTFLVMGWHWGVWVPGYLFSIPLLVLLFSYVYCVSVLVAVKTRSTVAATLIALGAWAAFAVPPMMLQLFDSFPTLKQREALYTGIRVVSWIPPKTADIPYLAAKWADAGTTMDILPPAMTAGAGAADQMQMNRMREMEEKLIGKSRILSIGSSLLFEALVVLWAMWIFCRNDY